MENKYSVLIVDDEPDIRVLVKDILEDEGFRVDVAGSADEARKHLDNRHPDLVLLDIWMSDEDGITLLREWHEEGGTRFPVLVMSGHGTVETAVEATRLGARGFIEKPLTTSKLLQSVRDALPADVTSADINHNGRGYEFVGDSEVMSEFRHRIERVAVGSRSLLITGEDGTRHLALAETIHTLSEQKDKELRVAPSADWDWEDARGKVLCILKAELTAAQEARLVQILRQDSEAFARVMILQHDGSDFAQLQNAVAQDALLALLKPEWIQIPSLHAHAEDVPKLIHASIDYCCQHYNLPYRKISIAAQNHLLHYRWPGNLTELDALVHDLLAGGNSEEITLDEVKRAFQHSQLSETWFETVLDKPIREAREMFEKIYLERQLERVGGSISQLAVKIDMERTHLYRKLRALGVRYKTDKPK